MTFGRFGADFRVFGWRNRIHSGGFGFQKKISLPTDHYLWKMHFSFPSESLSERRVLSWSVTSSFWKPHFEPPTCSLLFICQDSIFLSLSILYCCPPHSLILILIFSLLPLSLSFLLFFLPLPLSFHFSSACSHSPPTHFLILIFILSYLSI